jgi:hypothetical protein
MLGWLGLVLLLSFAAPPALAQAASPAAETLQPLQFLAGTWQAEFASGDIQFTVTRTYRMELGGKFLRLLEVLRHAGGEMASDTWLGYDPARQAAASWTFAADGSYALFDRVTVSAGSLNGEGRRTGGAQPGPMRCTLRRENNNRFVETCASLGGTSPATATLAYTRSAVVPVQHPAASAPAAPALQPLAMLAGQWRTEGESDGAKYAVDYAIGWTLGGHALRSDYSVTTNGQTELHAVAFMVYDAEAQGLVQFGFSADGSVSTLRIKPAGAGLLFDGHLTATTRRGLRITYARPSPDTLHATTEMERQGIWRSSGTVALQRRK